MKNTIVIRSNPNKVDVVSNGLKFEEAVDMLTDALHMVCMSQGHNEGMAQMYVIDTLVNKFRG